MPRDDAREVAVRDASPWSRPASRRRLALGVMAGCLLGAGLLLTPAACRDGGLPLPLGGGGNRSGPETGLVFSTHLGGAREDSVRDVAIDRDGNIYLTGGTGSPTFPTTSGAYQRTFAAGGTSLGSAGAMDVFVTKLDPDGRLVWSTFLGGPNYDRAYAIEVDGEGHVYVGGRAGPGFPTTPGSVQPRFGGDVGDRGAYGAQDGFVAKLAPDGSRLIWSTYFGGDGGDFIRGLAIDEAGDVYLAVADVGRPNPHVPARALQPSVGGGTDGIVAKLSGDGSRVRYATYLGGRGNDAGAPSIRVDARGHAYFLMRSGSPDLPVTPGAFQRLLRGAFDMFLAKLAPDGSALLSGTYYGGSGEEGGETHNLALDEEGNALLAAWTSSADLPTTSGAVQSSYGGRIDGFVAKLSADGTALQAGTYLGGTGGDNPEGVAFDRAGRVYVGGATGSRNFPVTPTAPQPRLRGGGSDMFVAVLSPALDRILFATYLGGSRADSGRTLALDGSDCVVVGGTTESRNWPTRRALAPSPGGGWDGVVLKLERVQNGGFVTGSCMSRR